MLTKAQIKRRIKKVVAFVYRIPLKNKDFTIISNNCWGGCVYDRYALPYRTPTVGLWIPAGDYLKFIGNLKEYLKKELIPISYKESHVRDILEEREKAGRYDRKLDDFVIGRIGDVDIIFLHYNTFDEAKEKWNRRKERINFDNIIVKYNDQNGFELNNFYEFEDMKYAHKLFFTSNKQLKNDERVHYIEEYEDVGYAVDDIKPSFKSMDITQYLNSVLE